MARLATAVLAAAVVLLSAIPASGGPPPEAGTLSEPGETALVELGVSEPVSLNAGSPTQLVTFSIPGSWKQGEPYWLGLRLHFAWTGEPATDDQARFTVTWNGRPFHMVEVVAPPRGLPGLRWVTADMVNGAASTWVLDRAFELEYTNFAPFAAFPSPEAALEFRLDLQDWRSAPPPTVKVFPDSAVIVTDWRPAELVFDADTDITAGSVALTLELRNLGWAAPRLQVTATVHERDGRTATATYLDEGGIAGRATAEVDLLVHRPGQAGGVATEPHAVDVEVNWGTGGKVARVWPAGGDRTGRPWFRPLVSAAGAAVALVVLWIALPLVFRRPASKSPRP